jgi:SpoVK/Ycf46/Vps4 family AAA+-type ATPase
MTSASTSQRSWAEQNRLALVRAFTALRRRLGDERVPESGELFEDEEWEQPPAIDVLGSAFGLNLFERELLLLCAGVEMEPALAERCAELSGGSARSPVTFGLAMAVLADAHWAALAPSAPLRRHRLIEVETAEGLMAAPLRIDERVLHYLAGVNELDRRLEGIVERRERSAWLSEEQWRMAAEVVEAERETSASGFAVHLFGDDAQGQEAIASLLARQVGRTLYVLRIEDTPAAGAEMEQFFTLWRREAILLPAMLLLQWEDETPGATARRMAERLDGPLVIASREPLRMHRALRQLEVNKAEPRGQLQMWKVMLDEKSEAPPTELDQVAAQFRLSAETIARLAKSTPPEALWAACKMVARPRLESLAQRIVPKAGWQDLVLPELQMRMLEQLASQSRHRLQVYEQWGFAERGRRGLGLSALFAGPSGTGKTLAAEVLARALGLDLYRIDLSAVVSKYIGETEKNLRQVFDAAETGGALLLFDEADALFGKRAEVKDSHDRYANIEVGYLLQRMESFEGLAVLTTNMKAALDKAFQRRLRFIVDFPFPDAEQREAIWKRAFPADTPTEGLDAKRLSSLNMAGGSIRNIALNAAFLAAGRSGAVRMSEVLEATRSEAIKTERPLVESEIRGWV